MQPSDEKAEGELTAEHTANPGYVLGQLASALAASQEHPDPNTRMRAARKIEQWVDVFQGMLSGALRIGSRTPVGQTPAWATLEVVQGGFATGSLLAEGPLQPHEAALLARLPSEPSAPPRARLNSYYVSDAGIAELQEMVRTGCYRIHVPEEGALLVVAWMLGQGRFDAAREILDAIGSYLDRLRFYPIPVRARSAIAPRFILRRSPRRSRIFGRSECGGSFRCSGRRR
ncbi:MAG TPA: hypothetical protein VKU00_25495 [Chthonomonadaceae bacterium]|nr:hypothetical protein [Chthonomonadaceae bacterium]